MAEATNQRSYYRVKDHALLKIRTIEASERERLLADFDGLRLRYSLTTHVSHQRQLQVPLMSQIRKQNPAVASYLAHLERQLEFLASQLTHELDFDENAKPQPINLSATGMSFESTSAMSAGQTLEVGILLQPDQRLVFALGTAVRVETSIPAGEGNLEAVSGAGATWVVSVSFDRINEEDQELLIKHVHRIHRAEIQASRESARD